MDLRGCSFRQHLRVVYHRFCWLFAIEHSCLPAQHRQAEAELQQVLRVMRTLETARFTETLRDEWPTSDFHVARKSPQDCTKVNSANPSRIRSMSCGTVNRVFGRTVQLLTSSPVALQNDALNFGLEDSHDSTIRYLQDEKERIRLARGDNDSR